MNYKIIGVNSDKDFCSCCGKQNLSKVVWIENTESSKINHYGTTCAAYLLSPVKDKKVKIDTLLIKEAASFENSIFESLPWCSDMKQRIELYAKALLEAGYESRFSTVAIYTTGFCNFINPYRRMIKKSIAGANNL